MNSDQLIASITDAVIREISYSQAPIIRIPLGISNRHIHLSQEDIKILFGKEAKLTKYKDLSQPNQYACDQKVTLVGPGGVIEKVRILGPTRTKTQVEVAMSDCIKLGIQAPLRKSGDLKESAGLTLVGPAGSVTLKEGVIIAARHIHMHTGDAVKLGFKDNDYTAVETVGSRRLIFEDVLVRIGDNFRLEMHIDVDEANAALLTNSSYVVLKTS